MIFFFKFLLAFLYFSNVSSKHTYHFCYFLKKNIYYKIFCKLKVKQEWCQQCGTGSVLCVLGGSEARVPDALWALPGPLSQLGSLSASPVTGLLLPGTD